MRGRRPLLLQERRHPELVGAVRHRSSTGSAPGSYGTSRYGIVFSNGGLDGDGIANTSARLWRHPPAATTRSALFAGSMENMSQAPHVIAATAPVSRCPATTATATWPRPGVPSESHLRRADSPQVPRLTGSTLEASSSISGPISTGLLLLEPESTTT